MGLKAKSMSKRYKKARYAIWNVSKKYLSNIVKDLYKLPYKIYERRRPKREPIDSYFYQTIQLANFIMRDDALNSHVYFDTKQIPVLHVCSTYKSELKEFLGNETLSQIYSRDEDESKGIIVD